MSSADDEPLSRSPVPLPLRVGGMVALLTLGVFGVLGTQVAPHTELARLDRVFSSHLENHGTDAPELVAFLRFMTNLGDTWTMVAIAAVVALVLGVYRHWLLLATWLAAQASGGILNFSFKWAYGRTRPAFATPLVNETTFSFPSGHSMASLVTYGMLIYLVVLLMRPGWGRRVAVTLLAGLVLTIGFSRIYLGAHWLSDVLGGFALGLAIVATSVGVAETLRQKRLA